MDHGAEAVETLAGRLAGSPDAQVESKGLTASVHFHLVAPAHRDEVAFVKNTSEGISTVAHGLDWQWGDRVVSTDAEYRPTSTRGWSRSAPAA